MRTVRRSANSALHAAVEILILEVVEMLKAHRAASHLPRSWSPRQQRREQRNFPRRFCGLLRRLTTLPLSGFLGGFQSGFLLIWQCSPVREGQSLKSY
jgi:hypothetical protein